VLILKGVKVLCFDTLLQVLILKVVTVSVFLQPFTTGVPFEYEEGKLSEEVLWYPHPGCFGKRGCKLLKTKDRRCKERRKRLQEIERSRLRAGATGGVREVSSRQHGKR